MRSYMGKIFHVILDDVTFTCDDGVSKLPHMTAKEYAEGHGTICAKGLVLILPQLVQKVSALETEVSALKAENNDFRTRLETLELGQPKLVQAQEKYRKILRRDIAMRARERLSLEGMQPEGLNFFYWTSHLLQFQPTFLEERGLTEREIMVLNGNVITAGNNVAHNSSFDQLKEGLEGLGEDEDLLRSMTRLYNFIMSPQQP